MINSVILEYQTTIEKVESILKNLKEIGVNTADYDDVLTKISIEVNEALASFDVMGYSEKENVNKIYKIGTDKVKKLLGDLEKYKEYYQAINKCYYVQGTQNTLDFSVEELNNAVEDLITLLNVIKNYDGVSGNDSNTLGTLYEVIYDIIKMEYSYNGTSKLLNYCKDYGCDSVLLSKLILEDVESLNESKYDTSQINLLILKMKKNGETEFLDNELVYLISIQKNIDKYLEELSQKLEKIMNKLSKNKDKLESLKNNRQRAINYKDSMVQEDRDYNLEKRRTIILHSIPVALALGLIVGTNIGGTRLLFGSEYKTDVETYDAQTKQTTPTEEYKSRILDSNGKPLTDVTTINVTSPWTLRKYKDDNKTFFEREISSTKIKGVDYDDLSQYLELDLEKIKSSTEYSVVVERKDALTGADQYDESVYQVVKEHQSSTDSRTSKVSFGEYIALSFLLLLVDGMVIMMSELIFMETDYGVSDSLMTLIYELKRLKRKKTDVSDYIRKIKQLTDEMDNIFKESIETRKEFESLKQKPEFKSLLSEYQYKMSIIERYIEELDKSSELSLSRQKK